MLVYDEDGAQNKFSQEILYLSDGLLFAVSNIIGSFCWSSREGELLFSLLLLCVHSVLRKRETDITCILVLGDEAH
jgi:hypothetical protein